MFIGASGNGCNELLNFFAKCEAHWKFWCRAKKHLLCINNSVHLQIFLRLGVYFSFDRDGHSKSELKELLEEQTFFLISTDWQWYFALSLRIYIVWRLEFNCTQLNTVSEHYSAEGNILAPILMWTLFFLQVFNFFAQTLLQLQSLPTILGHRYVIWTLLIKSSLVDPWLNLKIVNLGQLICAFVNLSSK